MYPDLLNRYSEARIRSRSRGSFDELDRRRTVGEYRVNQVCASKARPGRGSVRSAPVRAVSDLRFQLRRRTRIDDLTQTTDAVSTAGRRHP